MFDYFIDLLSIFKVWTNIAYLNKFKSINSEGLPNKGCDYYISDAALKTLKDCRGKKPYIVSLSGLSLNDNCDMLKRVLAQQKKGIDGIELNLACEYLGILSQRACPFSGWLGHACTLVSLLQCAGLLYHPPHSQYNTIPHHIHTNNALQSSIPIPRHTLIQVPTSPASPPSHMTSNRWTGCSRGLRLYLERVGRGSHSGSSLRLTSTRWVMVYVYRWICMHALIH